MFSIPWKIHKGGRGGNMQPFETFVVHLFPGRNCNVLLSCVTSWEPTTGEGHWKFNEFKKSCKLSLWRSPEEERNSQKEKHSKKWCCPQGWHLQRTITGIWRWNIFLLPVYLWSWFHYCWPQPGLWWRNLIDWIRGTSASERKCDSQLHNWELLTWRLRATGVQCFAGYHPWGHRVGHDWATESTLSSSTSLCVRVWGRRIQNTTKNICQAEREKGGWGVEGEANESR